MLADPGVWVDPGLPEGAGAGFDPGVLVDVDVFVNPDALGDFGC